MGTAEDSSEQPWAGEQRAWIRYEHKGQSVPPSPARYPLSLVQRSGSLVTLLPSKNEKTSARKADLLPPMSCPAQCTLCWG